MSYRVSTITERASIEKMMALERTLSLYRCCKMLRQLSKARFLCSQVTISEEASSTAKGSRQQRIPRGPSLEYFIANSQTIRNVLEVSSKAKPEERIPFIEEKDILGNGRKIFFDVYGCQMNTSDTEIAWSVLQAKGYQRTQDVTKADVVLVMTCAIRDGAEQKIRKKLHYLGRLKRKSGGRMKIGVLGCMAERLKTKLLEEEKMVDVVCGPDAYRDLPRLLAVTSNQQAAVNVLLSLEETYADVMPVRLNEDSISAYVSIMRGCDNMCSYCIVPFTRGRERSRPIDSILEEVKILSEQGVKEVTLLGQNVNSYRDLSQSDYYGNSVKDMTTTLSNGFKTIYKPKVGGRRFSELLDRVSAVNPEMRVRFTAPHPKDFPDEVLQLICERPNVCNQLHLPAQTGSNAVLAAMRRGYTIEAYLQLVEKIRSILPDMALTSDLISGFCGETEEDHQDTLRLVREVGYSMVFAYPYSMRQKTHAYHKLTDDVPIDVKDRRYKEVLQAFREKLLKLNLAEIGNTHLVLVEGLSKKSKSHYFGRNDAGCGVVFPLQEVEDGDRQRLPVPGDFVVVKIVDATSHTLYADGQRVTTLQAFPGSQTHARAAL